MSDVYIGGKTFVWNRTLTNIGEFVFNFYDANGNYFPYAPGQTNTGAGTYDANQNKPIGYLQATTAAASGRLRLRFDVEHGVYDYTLNQWGYVGNTVNEWLPVEDNSEAIRTMTFKDGVYISEEGYAYLIANTLGDGTRIKYDDITLRTVEGGKTATLPCGGKVASGDIVLPFLNNGAIKYDGKTTSVEAGKNATLPCKGKLMKSDIVISVEEEPAATGYTVSFDFYQAGIGQGTDTNCTLRLFYSATDYEDITVSYYSKDCEKAYSNVIGVQIMSSTTSQYLTYTMGGVTDYLYNRGSGYSSAYLELTADIEIIAEVYDQDCITSDSLVTMADGTTKAIGDIDVGDEILSYDWNTMTLVPNKVIYTSKDEDPEQWKAIRYFKRTFSDGTVIKNVFAHRFYNLEQKKFVYLEHWNIGEHTYKEDGTHPYLVSVETVYEECTYSRITGELGTNYFANGLLTGDRHCPTDIEL